ncbi:hypothetical protein lerEdw1_010904, partial [Lerista edwardsae]
IEDVLERLCLQQQPVAFRILSVLAKSHLEKTLEAFLNLPFRDYQEHWAVLLSSARHTEIFQQLAMRMPNVTGQAKCAVQVLQHFLRSAGTASKETLKELFPQLSLALLGQIYACGGEQEELIKLAQATLRDLFRAIGIKDSRWKIRSGSTAFRDRLSAFVRLLVNQGAWTIPSMAAYIVQVLEDSNPTTVPEVSIATYIEARQWMLLIAIQTCMDIPAAAWRRWQTADSPLASPPPADLPPPLRILLQLFLHRRCIQADLRTVDHFCRWLGHSNVRVRQLSLQGLALLLQAEMDPWTTQMAILRALSSAAHGDIIPDLMDLVETILPGLLGGEDTFVRLLATIYIQHRAHVSISSLQNCPPTEEDERVRAAAIEHLCRLRSKLPSPLLMGDALSEFVHILLHVDEEEVVATVSISAISA